MTLRFRKRVGLFGGLAHINLSLRGVSVSAGPNGANANLDLVRVGGRRKHPRVTLGIPGTGLSYQENLTGSASHEPQQDSSSFASTVVKLLEKDLKRTEPDDGAPCEPIPPPLISDGRRKSLLSISFRPAVIILVTMILVFFAMIASRVDPKAQAAKTKVEKTTSQPTTRSIP